MHTIRTYGERWRVVRTLGRGGQGVVYEVLDVSKIHSTSALGTRLKAVLRDLTAVGHDVANLDQDTEAFIGILRDVSDLDHAPRGALKELLPSDDAVNAVTAAERMKRELEVLASTTHPALIRILDSDPEQRWFVTEFFTGGTLAGRIEMLRGRTLDALVELRPVVEAVARLHAKGIVHRDIKPDNVFIGDRGQLVLGDCGLAIKLDDADRLTDTYENVGTRDWMPGWAHSMRIADVKPTFDVFSLGKLLWAMIAGKNKLRLWYHSKPEFDLQKMFPDDESIRWVSRLLSKTVVEDAEDCLPDAGALLREFDRAIDGIRSRQSLVNGVLSRRCTVCGGGRYTKVVDHNTSQQNNFGLNVVSEPKFRIFVCGTCGHAQFFYSMDGIRPSAWKE